MFYFKLQLFPYFVYYMSLVIDFYPRDLDILSAQNNLSIVNIWKEKFELGI